MYKELIEQATHDQLKEFARDAMSMLKETNSDTFDTLEIYLYKELYGCHFNEWMLKKATEGMKNEDGTKGPHWTLNETNDVARSLNISFDDFNEYDWNYVMNMIRSDYYGSIPNDPASYAKLACKFLRDKDAPSGKAMRYYLAFKE